MKKLTPQELNFESFRCELRILPEAKIEDYSNKLNDLSALSIETQREVALALFQDKTVDKKERTSRAMEIWQKLGDDTSLLYLATAYYLINNDTKATEILRKSANLGNKQAQLRTGYATLMGVGTNPDLKKATDIFKRLAKEKLPEAVYFTGAMFLLDEEDFVQKDPQKARKLLLWSVNNGCKFAQFEHGVMLLKDENTKDDGIKFIYAAAKQQEVRAMMWLAIELARGTTIPRNIKESQKYLEKCYNLRFTPAVMALKEAMNTNN